MRLSLFGAVCGMVLVGAAVFAPARAEAALLFCNQTKSMIEAALGRRHENGWTSEGWWQIQPGQCSRVYNKPLTQRFFFYYARALTLKAKDGDGVMTWSGKYAFCIDNKAFKIDGDSGCEARGYRQQGFQDVDVGNQQKSYTLTFREER